MKVANALVPAATMGDGPEVGIILGTVPTVPNWMVGLGTPRFDFVN